MNGPPEHYIKGDERVETSRMTSTLALGVFCLTILVVQSTPTLKITDLINDAPRHRVKRYECCGGGYGGYGGYGLRR
ncbi:hypothetical protein Q1695_011220 [Nippostrongylus brasiliensis]|nr:hypothetical protein Q1695_011220 [Nippostrongylus brasiliensis]